MNEKKVSIIVPIYNQESILSECLGNLVHQTLSDIEIILVNDASTDNSLGIMHSCQAQFPELIRIIDSKDNLGPGGARNLGIEAASGKYIGFVDSDDLALPTMYETLFSMGESTGYDVIDCGYYSQNKDLAILHTPDDCCGILDDSKRRELIAGGGYVFSKLYRKNLFADTNLRFRKNVILEDADFMSYLYATISSIGSIKEILYFYRDTPASASKILQTDKYYTNIYEAITHIYQKLHPLPNYEEIRPAVEYELLQMYSYGINICLKAYQENASSDILQLLENLSRLKASTVSGNYENSYVKGKLSPLDISIMKLNDLSPQELLKQFSSCPQL